MQIRQSQLARGARHQQNLEVNEHALSSLYSRVLLFTSPLVLTHVVVHLGRCPPVVINNNSLGGSIIIIRQQPPVGSITLQQQPPPPMMMVVVVVG